MLLYFLLSYGQGEFCVRPEAYTPEANLRYYNMKCLVFVLSGDGIADPSRGYPPLPYYQFIHLGGEVLSIVKCLVQEHNAICPRLETEPRPLKPPAPSAINVRL